MKKRIISLCLVLVLVLVLGLVPAAGAASAADMTDVSGHWAEEHIAWVLEQGLFNGVSETQFDPNSSMTRGMFVTVLGRFAGINPEEYEDWYLPFLYTDVNSAFYYAPYINWATRYGITTGAGSNKFNPDQPINREQMATFMVRFAEIYGYEILSITDEIPASFEDMDKVSAYAAGNVEMMRLTGVMNGRTTATGYVFDPLALATRAECAAVFHRLDSALEEDLYVEIEEPMDISLSDTELTLNPGDSYQIYAWILPDTVYNETVTWVSSDPATSAVERDGTVTAKSVGTAVISAYTCNGIEASCTVTVEQDAQQGYVGYAGESKASKMMNVFGEIVDDPRHPYGSDAIAADYLAHIVTVQVKVWDFKDGIGSEKITKTLSVQVHENLALTVEKIFEEIYACEAKYPIKYIGGYRWSSKSEHTPGLAIDINWNENFYCDPDGNAITGELFDPENNPYSMPIDGEIQQIFEKYGFTRGIYWRSGYKDYMHYSFFGT